MATTDERPGEGLRLRTGLAPVAQVRELSRLDPFRATLTLLQTYGLIIALVTIAGCRTRLDGAPDDAAALDQSLVGSGLCAGTSLASTCVEAFFDALFACFDPTGPCTSDTANDLVCWSDGNAIASLPVPGARKLAHGEALCADEQFVGTGSSIIGLPSGIYTYRRDGQTLAYDNDSGEVTCPDGSRVQLSSAPGKFMPECPSIANHLYFVLICDHGNCS
jgi:hypothetical protein